MAPSDTARQLEALLFALGRSLSRAEIATLMGISGQEVEHAIEALRQALGEGGVELVDDGGEVALRVGRAQSALVERARKEEYAREIGRAGLEVLAAILYRGPLTRAEVDFIRGVNSTQTLRTLTMRGLLRRMSAEGSDRALPAGRRSSYLYEPTVELLATLGAPRAQDLPEYEAIREKLRQLEDAYRARESQDNSHE